MSGNFLRDYLTEPSPAELAAVVFSDHSCVRFRDRVLPAKSVIDARKELARIQRDGLAEVSDVPPAWLKREDNPDLGKTDGYLMIGSDIAMPLVRVASGALVAQTALIRGGIGDGMRAYRNRHRQNVAARKRAIKANGKHMPDKRKEGPEW
jgi:hypothetical protein